MIMDVQGAFPSLFFIFQVPMFNESGLHWDRDEFQFHHIFNHELPVLLHVDILMVAVYRPKIRSLTLSLFFFSW